MLPRADISIRMRVLDVISATKIEARPRAGFLRWSAKSDVQASALG